METTLNYDENNLVIIYTGDNDVDGETILKNVNKTFDYQLDTGRIVFIFLNYRWLVDDKTWSHFTLLGQAIGSMILTAEAVLKCPPDIWCDTMGYPFGYPVVHILIRIPVLAYTHYPIISTDMLKKLKSQAPSMKNKIKYYYWKLFMFWYKLVGRYVTISMTNSTWTFNHVNKIWSHFTSPLQSKIVYPPCSSEKLATQEDIPRKNQAVILAQFRPEKRHKLIIESYANFLKEKDETALPPKLIFIGSTRSQLDKDYVATLEKYCFEDLKIPQSLIEFLTDCPYDEIKKILNESTFGINSMWNEHFGIAVVEYLASGLIPLVHASAGPLLDIVVPWDIVANKQMEQGDSTFKTGFFFTDNSDPDYSPTKKYPTLAELFNRVCSLTTEEKFAISERGKCCALTKFSDMAFDEAWDGVLDTLTENTSLDNNKKDR